MSEGFKICIILFTDLVSEDFEAWCGQEPIFNRFKAVLQLGFIIFQYNDKLLEVDKFLFWVCLSC